MLGHVIVIGFMLQQVKFYWLEDLVQSLLSVNMILRFPLFFKD